MAVLNISCVQMGSLRALDLEVGLFHQLPKKKRTMFTPQNSNHTRAREQRSSSMINIITLPGGANVNS